VIVKSVSAAKDKSETIGAVLSLAQHHLHNKKVDVCGFSIKDVE
jgi:hypothetical protein